MCAFPVAHLVTHLKDSFESRDQTPEGGRSRLFFMRKPGFIKVPSLASSGGCPGFVSWVLGFGFRILSFGFRVSGKGLRGQVLEDQVYSLGN